MTRRLPIFIRVLPPLLALGCGTGTWAPEFRGNDLARTGMTSSHFDDGCSLEISAMPIVLHRATLMNESGFDVAISDEPNTIYDATYDESIRLWEEEVGAYQYNWHELLFAPGIATSFGEGIEENLAKEFDSMNGGFGLYGTLTCGDTSVSIRWVFSQTIQVKCRYLFKIPKDSEGVVLYEVDPSPLFRQSHGDTGSTAILGQAIVNADLNDDGEAQLNELAEIPLSTLDGYDDDPLDNIDNLYQHLELNLERVIQVGGDTCFRTETD